jgi:hypothetical protein
MRTLIEQRIITKCRLVDADEAAFHTLSTAEKIAVALVLNRRELLSFYGTVLEAVHRLGEEWHAAAYRVQREGWRVEQSEEHS